jgi:hypothetical protein
MDGPGKEFVIVRCTNSQVERLVAILKLGGNIIKLNFDGCQELFLMKAAATRGVLLRNKNVNSIFLMKAAASSLSVVRLLRNKKCQLHFSLKRQSNTNEAKYANP